MVVLGVGWGGSSRLLSPSFITWGANQCSDKAGLLPRARLFCLISCLSLCLFAGIPYLVNQVQISVAIKRGYFRLLICSLWFLVYVCACLLPFRLIKNDSRVIIIGEPVKKTTLTKRWGGGGVEKLEKAASSSSSSSSSSRRRRRRRKIRRRRRRRRSRRRENNNNRAVITRCQFINVCVVSIIVKRPVLPPCVVDGRSRNPLYYYYYYTVPKVPLGPYNTPKRKQIILSAWILAFPQPHWVTWGRSSKRTHIDLNHN